MLCCQVWTLKVFLYSQSTYSVINIGVRGSDKTFMGEK